MLRFQLKTLDASAQNRVGELYSLVRFLRISPYAYYYCNTGRSKCAVHLPNSSGAVSFWMSRLKESS